MGSQRVVRAEHAHTHTHTHTLIYFWLHWIFVAVLELLIVVASLVAERGL